MIRPGWGGDPAAREIVAAATEITAGLTEQDLLLVLLSPGALRALLLPPPGSTPEEFSAFLAAAHEQGASGREVGLLARVLGAGAVGGRLAKSTGSSDVATFIVDRGDGPGVVGGGPTRPVTAAEIQEARAALDRIGLATGAPPGAESTLASTSERPAAVPDRIARPVVVASPADALRAAADTLFDKGWTSRLAFLELREDPETSADRFLERSEELVRAEGLGPTSRTRGIAAFAMMTLGLPEGVDEGPALGRFLVRTQSILRRREMSVGLFRTAGVIGSVAYPAGGVVGPPTDPQATWHRSRARAVPMRSGITDVGFLAVSICPTPASSTPREPADR
jgi:hypothetical protein